MLTGGDVDALGGLARAPFVEFYRLPLLRLGGAVTCVHYGVYDVAIVKGLHRLTAVVHCAEHVAEHVDVAELGDLVADGEEPALLHFCLLGDVTLARAGGEHLEAGAQPVVQPDGALGAADLIAQVHATPEGPAYLELADRPALEPDQPDAVVLGVDGVHQRVGPAHDLDGPVGLADEAADDLDAVAAHVDDRAPAGELRIPEPGAVRAGVRLAAADPERLPDRAVPHRLQRLERFRRIDQILQIAGEDARSLDRLQHLLSLLGLAPERLGAEDGLAGPGGLEHDVAVEEVRQANHDGVGLRVLDRLVEVNGPVLEGPILGEGTGALLGAGIDNVHAVAAAPAVEGEGVERADQASSEQRYAVHGAPPAGV